MNPATDDLPPLSPAALFGGFGITTMPKYTTLTELSAAFKSGELDSSYHLVIDKGGCSLRLRQNGPPMEDGEEAEEAESQRYEHCEQLFRREYDCPLEELFELAGIPAEWC